MSMANLSNFEARYGYGLDALGRPSYQNQFSMYGGPRDFIATQDVHNDLKARASLEDPQSMMIRELLLQMKRQNLPGNVRLPVFPIAPAGNMTYAPQDGGR